MSQNRRLVMGFFLAKLNQKAVECNTFPVVGRELARPIISHVRTGADDGRGQPSKHTPAYTGARTGEDY